MIWGKTREEKSRIIEAKRDLRNWYAWYPVKLNDGRWVWCQMLSRCIRGQGHYCYIHFTLKGEEEVT